MNIQRLSCILIGCIFYGMEKMIVYTFLQLLVVHCVWFKVIHLRVGSFLLQRNEEISSNFFFPVQGPVVRKPINVILD